MKVIQDTGRYQTLLRENEAVALPLLMSNEIHGFDSGAHVLTGDKTPDYGGGPSPFGFVILDGKVVARIAIAEIRS